MAWKSSTFTRKGSGRTPKSGDIQRAADRHKDAIEDVVRQAKELASESMRQLDRIKDPDLRRSAKR
jgi:hypothetical protein